MLEIGIVLAVTGLVIGGVLYGKSALRSAELRTVVKEVGELKSAMQQFKTQYNALPGDMTNATAYWGTDAGCPNTAYNTVLKKQTCNGDGDLKIGDSAVAAYYERFRAIQQLSNAGFLTRMYTGAKGNSGTTPELNPILGVNTPVASINGGGYMLGWRGTGGGLNYFTGNFRNVITFGSVVDETLREPVITSDEALNIDTKLDDGRPGLGGVVGPKPSSDKTPNCATTNVETTAQYKLSASGLTCLMIFVTGL